MYPDPTNKLGKLILLTIFLHTHVTAVIREEYNYGNMRVPVASARSK